MWVSFDGVLIRETKKAYLFQIEGTKHWFPKSRVQEVGPNRIVVSEWIAVEKGLADEDLDDGDDLADTWHPGHPSNYGDQ